MASIPTYQHTTVMSDMTFARWLKARRIERGLTQIELEHDAGLSEKYVSAAERGRVKLPEPETRERIHHALGTTEDQLVEAGLLKRLDFDGGPVYVNPRNITPGDRAAAEAHDRLNVERRISEDDAPYTATDDHTGLRAHLQGYGLTERQIRAITGIVEAFVESEP